MEKIKDRLKKSRKSSGYTQENLAKILGFSQVSLIEWEKGRVEPKPHVLEKWAKITKVDPAWLLTGEGNYEYTSSVRTETEPEAISVTTEEKLKDKDEIIGLLKEKIVGLEARLAKYEGDGGGEGTFRKRKKL